MKDIKVGYVYNTEVADGKVRPAVVLSHYGNFSVIIPMRKVYVTDLSGITNSELYVNFYGNADEGSIAQCGSIKSVPDKKIGRELGELYDIDKDAIILKVVEQLKEETDKWLFSSAN